MIMMVRYFLIRLMTNFLFTDMVDIEQQGSSDLKRECIVMDSDKEVPDGVQVSLWWPQRLGMPTQYIYDAIAERTMQHLQEKRRPPNIASLALDTVGAISESLSTSSLAAIPKRPPVEQKASASFCFCLMTVLFLYCAVQMPAESPRTETLMLSSTGVTVVGVSLYLVGSLLD
jgi:hypothetical protein